MTGDIAFLADMKLDVYISRLFLRFVCWSGRSVNKCEIGYREIFAALDLT